MWVTFLIWRVMNSQLPVFNPFRKLLKLKLTSLPSESAPKFLTRMVAWLPQQLVGCLTGLAIMILTIWVSLLCIIFITPIVFVFFGSLPMLMFLVSVSFGCYLAVRITNNLGKIRSAGIYDLIGVSAYGNQRATWLIGRTVYRDINWLRDTRMMLSNTVYIIIAFLILMAIFGFVSAIATPATSTINLLFLETISGLGFLTVGIYFAFVQAMVMGYLIAMWSINLTTDRLNRMIATIGGFWGFQIVVYMVAFVVLVVGLPMLFESLNWSSFLTLGFAQLLGLVVIHDMSVRLMLRLLTHQAELPYTIWWSELEL
jgi:hypothetical protein